MKDRSAFIVMDKQSKK